MSVLESPIAAIPSFASFEVDELVHAAREGDNRAFDELVRRFEGAVFATAYRRLNNHAEAQEVCQEVFLQAFCKLGQLETAAAFGGWIRSIAARMAINRRVRRKPLVAAEPNVLEESLSDEHTPLSRALDQERALQVRAGLKRLGDLDRKTLVAFYVEGQSLLEMSDRFASPVGTIKRRLHVARKRLAVELESVVAL